jgi:hypothetical protein
MKKATIIALAVCLIGGLAVPANAQFFMSQFSDARTVPADAVDIGGGISIFDHVLGVGGIVRVGIMDDLEFGARLGFVNYDNPGGDDHTGLSLGGNILYQFMSVDYGDPVDLATGGGIEYYNWPGDATLLLFGSNTIVSYPVEFESGQVLSPFFRLNLRFESYSNGASDTEFELGFGFGAQFDITQYFGLFAEFAISSGYIDDGFVGGVSFSM